MIRELSLIMRISMIWSKMPRSESMYLDHLLLVKKMSHFWDLWWQGSMNITYKDSFNRAFCTLPHDTQETILETILFFKENLHHISLRNDPLEAPMLGKRSISVWPDIRIIFIEKWDYIEVLMLDVGDHVGVYFW